MINLEQCKKTLNNGKRKFNNEEISAIRNYLYLIAEIELTTKTLENNKLI